MKKALLKLKDWSIAGLILLVLFAFLAACEKKQTPKQKTVKWYGPVALGVEQSGEIAVGYMPEVVIGLRSDGVLVWKDKDAPDPVWLEAPEVAPPPPQQQPQDNPITSMAGHYFYHQVFGD